MSQSGTSEQGIQMLQRIVAMLFALSGLAGRAAPRSRAVRLSLLLILTPAAAIARRMVVRMARDLGFHADFSDFDHRHEGDGANALIRLAYCFAELATTLSELLATVECYVPPVRRQAVDRILQRIEPHFLQTLRSAAHLPGLAAPFPDTS